MQGWSRRFFIKLVTLCICNVIFELSKLTSDLKIQLLKYKIIISGDYHLFSLTGRQAGAAPIDLRIENNVLNAIRENPHASTRSLALELQTSHATVHKVLKRNRFHPFKATTVQELSEHDKQRRENATELFIEKCFVQIDFLRYICFTDECIFYEDGTFNRHNNHFWAVDNPDWTRVTHRQRRWSVNVWAGVFGDHIIGPVFIDGNVNGQTYLQFIQEQLDQVFEDIDEEELEAMYFQQDGHPAHRTNAVVDALNEKFPGRWIGLRGPIEWPPRSPDLTLCDCFLWGYLKEVVYAEPRPQNVEQLKEKIIAACATITPEMLSKAGENLMERIFKCNEQRGGHFEQLM